MINLKGNLIYTGNGIVENGFDSIDGSTNAGVGTAADGEVAGSYPVITPAIIDAHCHIGLIRGGEPSAEAEANDHMGALLAHADVLDSIQMDDAGFEDSIECGVLYSCVLPGSGNIIGGNSAVIRNYGLDTNAAFIRRSGIKAAFGYNPMYVREWKGQRPYTRMGALAMLRAKLHEVKAKMDKEAAASAGAETDPETKNDVAYTAEEAVMKAILTGEERMRIHVHKADDIAAIIRFVEEWGLKVVVEHTMDIHQPGIYEQLKEHGIPVIYGPMDCLAYKVELKHEGWKNVKYLIDSGVEFGLMTDHPVLMQKMLLFELRHFIRMGLTKEQALDVITKKNADLIGVGDVLGTLEKGKWASVVCWSGDPFALDSHPVAIYAEGELIFEA